MKYKKLQCCTSGLGFGTHADGALGVIPDNVELLQAAIISSFVVVIKEEQM